MPGARFFPDARLNFAENLLRRERRRRRASSSGARTRCERRLSWDELARAGLADAAVASRRMGVEAGRPGRRDDAEHARDGRRHARHRLARRRLVVLLARFRRARRARPLRPDRAGASSSRRTAIGTTASRSTSATRSQAVAAQLPSLRTVVVVDYLGDAPRPSRRASRWPLTLDACARARSQAAPVDLRAPALRASALHPVFVGHDGHAEMHRPFGGRHAAAAPEGAPAACGLRRRRPACSTSPPAAG